MELFNRKVLIIGIDGASWDIFNNVLEKGFMPYLKNLKENASFGILKSTIPPISPSAWGTIQNGKNPLNNHIYEFYVFNKINKQIHLVNSSFLKNTIWDILSNVGKKVALINIPLTYPPKKINGYIVSGLLTPSLESNFTYPPDLKDKILEKVPDYQLKYTEEKRHGRPIYNPKEFVNKRIKNLKDRTKVCVYLLHNYRIDVMMVNFQANDILQHSLWGFIKSDHDLYNKEMEEYILDNFHKTLDLCIETLREEFIRTQGEELLTLIISDHGFETHQKQFFLGDWCLQKGLLKTKESLFKTKVRKIAKNVILKIRIQKLQNFLLRKSKQKSDKSKSEIERTFFQQHIDWDNSSIIPLGIGLYGYIFILKEGEERKKIQEHFIDEMNKIIDNKTGKKLIEKIFTREEIYTGDQPELIPDLILKPIKGYSFNGYIKGKKGDFFSKIDIIKDSESIGKHNEDGIIIMDQKNLKKKFKMEAHLLDIVPTILNYLGLPIPEDLKGRILS